MHYRFVKQKQITMENNSNFNNRENGRIVGGLILVAVGAVLLLRNIGFLFPNWLFSWPMILILIGIYSGFKHQFRNNSSIILIAIGGFFLFDRFIPEIGLQPYFWPVLIIVIGIIFILRPKRFGRFTDGFNENEKIPDDGFTPPSPQTYAGTILSDNNYLQISSIFSGVNRTIVSKDFKGGKINCVFGGTNIDLTPADIQGEAVLKFEVIFGGVKLIVPPHFTVINEIDGVFHGVDDKRRYSASTNSSPDKKLILRGSVLFGGIEIKSY